IPLDLQGKSSNSCKEREDPVSAVRHVRAECRRASPTPPRRACMQPRIHVITLGVRDLERALAFYRDGLGLPSPGVIGTEFEGDETTPAGAAAMFELEGGVTLALYPRTELAKDANVDF